MRLLVLLLLLGSSPAFSFPENVRLGYPSCSVCHVSPIGGGVLTDYGKGTELEYLSSFGYAEPDGPKWLDTGWDIRLLHLMEKSPEGDSFQRILMQSQSEVAVHLSDQITVDASYGMYGAALKYPVQVPTISPTYYLKLTPRPWYTVRVGRFSLPYGLQIPDHTANIRGGLWFPANSQRDSLELSLFSSIGEVSFANFDVDSNSYSGLVSLFVGGSSKVSISGLLSPSGYSVGSSAIAGWSKSTYSLHEVDIKDDGKAYSYLIYNLLGHELYRGIHIRLTHEKTWDDIDSPNKYNISLQLFPVNSIEILGAIENYERPKTTTYSLMTHIFL